MDELEQYLLMQGMHRNQGNTNDEDTKNIVCQVSKLMNIKVEDADISVSHRLPQGKPWMDNNGVLIRRDLATDL